MKKRWLAVTAFLLLPFGVSDAAAAASGSGTTRLGAEAKGLHPARWDLRAGYGYQYTNTSRPTNFQVISLMLSAVVPLTEAVGPKWFRSRFDWNPELDLALFTHPYTRPKIGMTPLSFHWKWQTPFRWRPYLMAGAGILYANVNRRETRKDLNFNLQGGIGTYVDLNNNTSLIFEYRHVHISNAGLHEDNSGIDTHNFLAGVSIEA